MSCASLSGMGATECTAHFSSGSAHRTAPIRTSTRPPRLCRRCCAQRRTRRTPPAGPARSHERESKSSTTRISLLWQLDAIDHSHGGVNEVFSAARPCLQRKHRLRLVLILLCAQPQLPAVVPTPRCKTRFSSAERKRRTISAASRATAKTAVFEIMMRGRVGVHVDCAGRPPARNSPTSCPSSRTARQCVSPQARARITTPSSAGTGRGTRTSLRLPPPSLPKSPLRAVAPTFCRQVCRARSALDGEGR